MNLVVVATVIINSFAVLHYILSWWRLI